MKKALATFALIALAAVAARADVLGQWTFENGGVSSATGATFSYGPADSGANAAGSAGGGSHAATNTAWTFPSGNGSTRSLSADRWAVNDYYQFSLSSGGYQGILLEWDQTGSNTGPRDFRLAYSTDGSAFTDFGTYSITNDSWTTGGAPKTQSHYSFDLSSVTALDNQATVYFRLLDNSTTSITGGTVATGGTGRVDNFTVNASLIPEPSVVGLVGVGAALLVGAMRYRKRS